MPERATSPGITQPFEDTKRNNDKDLQKLFIKYKKWATIAHLFINYKPSN